MLIFLLFVSIANAAYCDERKNNGEKDRNGLKNEERNADSLAGRNDPAKNSYPATEAKREVSDPDPGYDETSVYVDIQRLAGKEISIVILNNIVYLPITEIFDYLKIKNIISPGMDSVTGFFIDPKAEYCIDNANNMATFNSKEWKLNRRDLILTSSNLYMKINYLNEIFGLDCIFDSYNLSLKLNTTMELPAIVEMRQKQMRGNIGKLTGTMKADITLIRSYPLFHLSMADWSVNSSQNGSNQTGIYGLMLGSVLAGGEADFGFNLCSSTTVSFQAQSYLWRYVNNDNNLFRQVLLGNITPQSIATIYAPIAGIQLTNRPTTFRRSFGTHTITDITKPGWTVELYVNNVLVDYTTADASGFYSLNVPLVYGSTDVKLRFYGIYGELQTKDKHIEIPVNFLPAGETEYNIISGIVEDRKKSLYSHDNINYGLSRNITLGGGIEYLSTITAGNYIPFLNTSAKLLSNMYFTGNYAYGARTKGTLNYRLRSNLQLELDYTSYKPGQTAILCNYLQDRKVVVSSPFNVSGFAGLTRLSVDQILLPGGIKQMITEWLVSTVLSGVSANLSTSMYTLSQKSDGVSFAPNIQSNFSLFIRLPAGIMMFPQLQYSFYNGQFINAKLALNKVMFTRGYLNIGVDHNFETNISAATIGFRYDFSFAKVAVAASRSNGSTQFSEVASGSLLYDNKTKYLETTNRSVVGKSGITLIAYLDLNGNGRHDAGEPRVPGLQVQIGGGRVKYIDKDTLVHITDLEPYTSYYIELTTDKFDNVSWQIRNKTIRIATDPNNIRMIELPVSIMYDISGTVSLKSSSQKFAKGLGQIKVNIYDKDSSLVSNLITESDGLFNYQGLRPGTYTVSLDTAQLKKLNYNISKPYKSINISNNKDGDITDGIDFEIQSITKDSIKAKPTCKTALRDSRIFVSKKKRYAILVYETKDAATARNVKARLIRLFKLPVEIVKSKDNFHIVITGFKTQKDAEQMLPKLQDAGFTKHDKI